MFQLSEAENRIQKFRLGQQLLKFYNWLFSVILTNFSRCARIEMLITGKTEVFFFQFFQPMILQKYIQHHAKFDFDC